MFRYVLLGLLRDGLPQHGYALMVEYRKRTGVKLSSGNFYRGLAHLAAAGLVRSTVRFAGADSRQAPYEITGDGIAAFDRWYEDTSGIASYLPEDDLSARMLFLSTVPRDVAVRVFDHWHERLWSRAKALEQRRAQLLGPSHKSDGDFPVLKVAFNRRLRHVAAEIQLLAEVRAAYEEWAAHRVIKVGSADRPTTLEERMGRAPSRRGVRG